MIFIDTSAFFALLDQSNASHGRALKAFDELLESDQILCTTNYVVLETVSLVQSRFGMPALRDLYQDLLPVVDVHFLDRGFHEAAIEVLFGENKRHLSLIDCSSFVFMRRNGIRTAFAYDGDFARSGFEIV